MEATKTFSLGLITIIWWHGEPTRTSARLELKRGRKLLPFFALCAKKKESPPAQNGCPLHKLQLVPPTKLNLTSRLLIAAAPLLLPLWPLLLLLLLLLFPVIAANAALATSSVNSDWGSSGIGAEPESERRKRKEKE